MLRSVERAARAAQYFKPRASDGTLLPCAVVMVERSDLDPEEQRVALLDALADVVADACVEVLGPAGVGDCLH